MVEVESPVAPGSQPDVHHVVCSGHKTDESRYEEDCCLGSVVWFGDGVRPHGYQAGSDD